MKKFLFLFLLTICVHINLFSQNIWNTVTPYPSLGLRLVVATDSNHLKAIEGSLPYKFAFSDDGGSTWNDTALNVPPVNLFFSDSMNGWITSNAGKIIHTIDGGRTWDLIQLNSIKYLTTLQFINDSVGFVLSDYSDSLFTTNDKGVNWNYYKTNIPSGSDQKIYFANALDGWILNGRYDTTIYRTTDGGLNWNSVLLPSQMGGYTGNGISFIDSSNGWLSGDSVIMRTIDGGNSWSILSSFAGGNIQFSDSVNGILVNNYWNNIYYTADGGVSWTNVFTPSLRQNSYLSPRCANQDQSFYVSTDAGELLKSNNGINWTHITWNSFPKYLFGPSPLLMSSAANGIFVSPTDCTNNSCGNNSYVTRDSGKTWFEVLLNIWNTASQTADDSSWYFTQTSYANNSSILYKSTDQLRTYFQIGSFPTRIRTICFTDSLHGLIGGEDDIFYTEDGGLNWLPANGISLSFFHVQSITFIDDYSGWLIADNFLARSTDRGHNWTVIYTDPVSTNSFYFLQMVDSLNGFVYRNYSSSIKVTSDGGISWVDKNTPAMVSDLYFIDAFRGWIACDSGIYYTDDGLNTFTRQYDKPIYSLSFLKSGIGFASCEGVFLSTDYSNLINEVKPIENSNEDVTVYPNPSSGKFSVESSARISKIEICDQFGKKLKLYSTINADSEISLSGFEKGLYLIKFYLANKIVVKNLIVL